MNLAPRVPFVLLAALLVQPAAWSAQEAPAATPVPEQAEPAQATPQPAPPPQTAPQQMARQAPAQPDKPTLKLTLDEALQIALGNDLGLKIQELSTAGARFDAAGAWGAFDPVLTATGSVFDAQIEASSTFSGAAVIEESTLSLDTGLLLPLETGGSFNLTFDLNNSESNNSLAQAVDVATTDVFGLEFRQPLLRGFGTKYATSQQRTADLEYLRQVERYRQQRQALISDVAVAYWDLVSALGQRDVARETLDLGLQQLDQNQRRLQAGVGTQVEVLQAETNVAQREEQLLLQETSVKSAADKLKAILYPGTNPQTWDTELEPTTPLPEPPDSALDLIPRWGSAWVVAQESRSELRQQRFLIEEGEVNLSRASSERRPSLDLLLSSRSRGYDGNSRDAFDKALGWDFPQNTAALTFSLPLGNRTARNAMESARADLRAARLSYDQLESQVISEVRTAIRQVTYSVQAVAAADKNHELAARQLEAEQARYREGLSTNFVVLQFQQQLAEALYSRNLARVNLAKSLVNLQLSQGILGEVSR